MRILYLSIFLAFAAIANCKDIQITKDTSLSINIPMGFTASKMPASIPNAPEGVDITNGDVHLKISAIPVSSDRIQQMGGLEAFFALVNAKVANASVEGKVNTKKFKNGLGFYAVFTDKSMVKKESVIGNWRMMTSGFIQGGDGVLNLTIFSHTTDSKEYLELMTMINSAKLVKLNLK